jgi:hypothetical protein
MEVVMSISMTQARIYRAQMYNQGKLLAKIKKSGLKVESLAERMIKQISKDFDQMASVNLVGFSKLVPLCKQTS